MCYNSFMPTVDDLILDLIATGRQATREELAVIIAHVTQAPFASYLARVPGKLRQLLAKRGMTLPARLPSLEIHLLKRIYDERQWLIGTTADQYVVDLHRAVAHPDVQVWTYRYFEQPVAGFMAPSHVQDAPKPEAYIFVAYSPLHGTITTGYQASDISHVFTYGYTNVVRHQ
jgi:hypothetical protein